MLLDWLDMLKKYFVGVLVFSIFVDMLEDLENDDDGYVGVYVFCFNGGDLVKDLFFKIVVLCIGEVLMFVFSVVIGLKIGVLFWNFLRG